MRIYDKKFFRRYTLMFKKAAALLLSAVIMTGASSAAFAEGPVQTVTVTSQMLASAAKTWDGKAELKAGESYVLKKSVTLSKKVTIPKGTTLTLNKGVKLGISSKGSLYVKGKLAMQSGSTLSVSGTFYTYSGSTTSCSGAMKLNKTAKATLGGKLTINKTGVCSGTPKSIKLGKKGSVSVKGKNTCKKLAALLEASSSDKQEIEKLLNGVITKVLIDGELYDGIAMALPKSVMEEAEKEFKDSVAEMGDDAGELKDLTLKDLFDQMYEMLIKPMMDEAGTINSVKVTVTKMSETTLTDEEAEIFKAVGKISKVYSVTIKTDIDFTKKPGSNVEMNFNEEPTEIKVVKIGSNWYLCGDTTGIF